MRYFLHIAYKGTKYHGWQRQVSTSQTVQQVLEDTISRMMNTPIHCHGCGRTDTGVHASQFFANIDINKEWDFDFVFRLNKMLPHDIAVFDIIPVDEKANAQYDAIKRRYNYYIHRTKTPFLEESSTLNLDQLDIEKMQNACSLFEKYKDYRSFCKQPDIYKNTLCDVSQAILLINEKGDGLNFQITANRFLRGMVRLIVGNLLELGKGKLSVDELESYLAVFNKAQFYNAAYPQGLYLSKITYPYLDLPTQNILLPSDNTSLKPS